MPRPSEPREVAACIQARLAAFGAALTDEQFARLVRVVAEKEAWDAEYRAACYQERKLAGQRARHVPRKQREGKHGRQGDAVQEGT